MRKISNNSRLAIGLGILSFIAGFYLFWFEVKSQRAQHQSGWAAVYFLEPQEDNLNFGIDNFYGKEVEYVWSLKKGGKILKEGTLKLVPEEKKEVTVEGSKKEGEILVKYEGREKILRKIK